LKTPGIVEPNGLDLGEFAALPPEGAFRGRHPELRGRAMILFLGRIHPKKGLDLLIPALARLGKEARLVIAGPDQQGYRTVVEGMIRREGVGDRVIFTGMLHGMERVAALRDADLFVLPSYQENFGIAVAEALAAGTPVVISDQVNIHREIAAAGVGQVVETNVAPLAAAIEAWLGDEKRRRSAGERGRDFVRERYDWRRIAEAWREHYGQWRKRDG
jgi:glycosyltransferase involved in cell wall biosynthesis